MDQESKRSMTPPPTVTVAKRADGWLVVVTVTALAGVAFRVKDRAHVIAGQTLVVVEKRAEEEER